jgi:hypothetical protein
MNKLAPKVSTLGLVTACMFAGAIYGQSTSFNSLDESLRESSQVIRGCPAGTCPTAACPINSGCRDRDDRFDRNNCRVNNCPSCVCPSGTTCPSNSCPTNTVFCCPPQVSPCQNGCFVAGCFTISGSSMGGTIVSSAGCAFTVTQLSSTQYAVKFNIPFSRVVAVTIFGSIEATPSQATAAGFIVNVPLNVSGGTFCFQAIPTT